MLNLFKLSPLTYLLLGSIALNLALGTATYKLHAAKAVSDAALVTCMEANKGLVLEIAKQDEVCKVQDQVVSEYQVVKEDVRDKEEVLLDAIDNIPPTNVRNKDILVEQLEMVVKEKKEQEALDTNEDYANLDALLPTDFSSLLESAHRQATD